jgi:hypothetical protein
MDQIYIGKIMNDLKKILLVLEKFGYPNNNFSSLCTMTGYNSDNFLADLIENLGEDKTLEFIGNTFDKLETDQEGIKISLWEPGEYVYLNIEDYTINEEESDDCVFIEWYWGDDSKVSDDNGKLVTLDQINDDNDPWDLDDFYDGIKEQCGDYITKLTGLNICWGI